MTEARDLTFLVVDDDNSVHMLMPVFLQKKLSGVCGSGRRIRLSSLSGAWLD